jgi:hypothetical protein
MMATTMAAKQATITGTPRRSGLVMTGSS